MIIIYSLPILLFKSQQIFEKHNWVCTSLHDRSSGFFEEISQKTFLDVHLTLRKCFTFDKNEILNLSD